MQEDPDHRLMAAKRLGRIRRRPARRGFDTVGGPRRHGVVDVIGLKPHADLLSHASIRQ
jgi:hypothetical protein